MKALAKQAGSYHAAVNTRHALYAGDLVSLPGLLATDKVCPYMV